MNTLNQRRYIREVFIGFWILLLPFFLFFHKAFGDGDTIVIFGRTIYHGFDSKETFMWYFLIKSVAVLSLLTWFITTNYRWKYFILVPLMVYFYTLIKVFEFIPILRVNLELKAFIITIMILFVITISDTYYFQKRRFIKLKLKGIELNKEFYKKVKTRKEQIEKLEKQLSPKAYYYELCKSKQLLGSAINKPKSESYIFSNWKKLFDILICTLLMLMAPIYFIYELIPDGAQSYPLLGLTIDARGFTDVSIFIWYISSKLCLIIPLCIWYITCRHWWRYAILSPIILFTYQLWGSYQNVSKEIDNYEYFRALPTILVLVVLLIFISNKIKYKARILDFYDNLSHEIELLLKKLNKEESDKIKTKYGFGIVRGNKKSSKKSTIYLKNLNEMKKELLKHLDQTN